MLENRKYPRYEFVFKAIISWLDSTGIQISKEYRTENISVEGGFFPTTEKIPLGTPVRVELFFLFDGFKESIVKLKGNVIRHCKNGMAIRHQPYKILRTPP